MIQKRYNVQYLMDEIQITIPSPKNTRTILLLGFWVLWWAILAAIMFVIYYNIAKEMPAVLILALFSLLIWGGKGLFGIYLFLWQLSGEEIVSVTPISISILRKVLGFGKKNIYLAENITGLGVEEPKLFPFQFLKFKSTVIYIAYTGLLTFRYKNITKDFGFGLEKVEAEDLLLIIAKRFPQYRQTAKYNSSFEKVDTSSEILN